MTAAYDPETLCLALLHADAEAEVVDILSTAGLWDDPELWRDLGDEPENYSTVGNQQSRAEQALVEKLVNAVDTKLIAASVAADVDPQGSRRAAHNARSSRAVLRRGIEGSQRPFEIDHRRRDGCQVA